MTGPTPPTPTTSVPPGLPAFDFQPLGRVVFAPGALAQLGEVVRSLGGRRVLLVTDPGLEHAGHPQRATKAMQGAGLEVFTFDGNIRNFIGYDLSTGIEYRPLLSNNIIVRSGVSMLIPASGFKSLYNNKNDTVDPLLAAFFQSILQF